MGGRGASFGREGTGAFSVPELPDLTGSRKQIAWAEDLRKQHIKDMQDAQALYKDFQKAKTMYAGDKFRFRDIQMNLEDKLGRVLARDAFRVRTDVVNQIGKEIGPHSGIKIGSKESMKITETLYQKTMQYGKEKLKNNSAKFWIDHRMDHR